MSEDGKLGTLLKNHVETARLYHLCAQRHEGLVGVVRGALGEGTASRQGGSE